MQSAVRRYYNINKILMSKLGSWPTQSTFMKILLPTIVTSFIFCIGFLEFVRLSEIWKNVTEDCESFIMVIITIGGYVKLFIIVLKSENIEQLLSLIDYHWRVFTHSLEVQIMHEYAIVGRKLTISYAVMIYSLMTLYMLIPVTPQLLDLIVPLNKSRPYKYLFDIDYSFDREVYYYPVLLHAYLTTVIAMSLMIITDTCYISLTQHACSLFAAIGHRLENLTSEISLKKDRLDEDIEVTCDKRKSRDCDEKIYRELVLLLRKHQLSIQYAQMLDSLFEMYSFLLLFVTIIVMSLLGIQILSLMDHKEEMIRYVSMVIGAFLHLFVLSYPGQMIMDHSGDLFHKAYNMLWYRMSRRTTQLLSILLYRCLVPCTLTAGKIYVLSMANYASMMQAALSYFTALSSFQ
ncbi:odorant receptor 4 isoform X1 [Monomorium pharaonis]|uniref:odorant receptor 4 isoform X1 n=2 Tax=Monomorium pharaonis TaxID=307658 RepID=UPI00174719B7|nr:odorant receptor 4 isoform X1 [Monomorium pharaonis]